MCICVKNSLIILKPMPFGLLGLTPIKILLAPPNFIYYHFRSLLFCLSLEWMPSFQPYRSAAIGASVPCGTADSCSISRVVFPCPGHPLAASCEDSYLHLPNCSERNLGLPASELTLTPSPVLSSPGNLAPSAPNSCLIL